MDWARGKAFTKSNEGCRLTAYQDTRGVWTVGYGQTGQLSDGTVVGPGVTLTQEQADGFFELRYAHAYTDATRDTGNVVFSGLDDVRQAALVDMAYNLGERGLAEFKHFLAYVALDDWQSAEDAGYASLWAQQVPNRAAKVMNMILTGQWPTSVA